MEDVIGIAGPDLGEEEAWAAYEVVRSGRLTQAGQVAGFEEEFAAYVGSRHAVAFFNGTVALHATLLACGIGAGEEVVVPAITFVSTATSVLHAGARVVFGDIDPTTFNLDPTDLARRISASTRAIMPVHYAGQAAPMDEIRAMAERHNLLLLEDAAEAHGATYRGRMVGTIGHAAMFSFTPTKNITCGEGGLVTTSDDTLASELRLLRNHGMDAPYHHIRVGYNYRMTEVQAAIGRVQLRKLGAILERKRCIARALCQGLAGIPGITPPWPVDRSGHTYMIFTILVDRERAGLSRDALADVLRGYGIETKIYFPPLHLQPIFHAEHAADTLPTTARIAPCMLSLPCHSQLTDEQVQRIVRTIRQAVAAAIGA